MTEHILNNNLPPQEININFTDIAREGNPSIGKFWYNRDKKEWTFEGNADASAQMFAQYMYSSFADIIDNNAIALNLALADLMELMDRMVNQVDVGLAGERYEILRRHNINIEFAPPPPKERH